MFCIFNLFFCINEFPKTGQLGQYTENWNLIFSMFGCYRPFWWSLFSPDPFGLTYTLPFPFRRFFCQWLPWGTKISNSVFKGGVFDFWQVTHGFLFIPHWFNELTSHFTWGWLHTGQCYDPIIQSNIIILFKWFRETVKWHTCCL